VQCPRANSRRADCGARRQRDGLQLRASNGLDIFSGDDGLAVDFIGTAQVGQWLAIEPDVIKTGSTICFAESFIKAVRSTSCAFVNFS